MTSHGLAELTIPRPDHLETLVQTRLGSRVRDLRIRIEPAGLVIQGRALTFHAKQLASHAAMELSKARVLANEIVVA